MDLTTGYNFCDPQCRADTRRQVKELKPALITLSPPRTSFSPLRQLSDYRRDPETVIAEQEEGDLHWDFALSLAEYQDDNRLGFLLKHPGGLILAVGESSKTDAKTRRVLHSPGHVRLSADHHDGPTYGHWSSCWPNDAQPTKCINLSLEDGLDLLRSTPTPLSRPSSKDYAVSCNTSVSTPKSALLTNYHHKQLLHFQRGVGRKPTTRPTEWLRFWPRSSRTRPSFKTNWRSTCYIAFHHTEFWEAQIHHRLRWPLRDLLLDQRSTMMWKPTL